MSKTELKNATVLRPYQKRWANDPARYAFAVKGAQIGFSTATAAWAVDRCLKILRRTITFLSRSEPQSRELAEKAKLWIDGYKGVVAEYFPNEQVMLENVSALQHRIQFPNGSRIIVLAANPETARGYTGDVVLDEFAFHKDADAIFRATFRQTTLGYSMRILSTPNGQQGMFFDFAKKFNFDAGVRPRRQPVGAAGRWSGHWCDIHLAVEEGAPINIEEVRAGCDEDTWLQEYCCQFISQASQWIPPELFQQNASSEAAVLFDPNPRFVAALYAGWDVARKRDLSVIWLTELAGDVTWTRGVVVFKNMPTPDQVREARALMPFVRRMNIDQSGMGLSIFETLQREFPGKVEGVGFTQPTKEAMAVLIKRRMEEQKLRLPDDDAVRQSFRSIKKTVNSLGQARFDAEHDAKYGHADHFWACALAEAAAERPAYHLDDSNFVGRARDEEFAPEPVAAEF